MLVLSMCFPTVQSSSNHASLTATFGGVNIFILVILVYVKWSFVVALFNVISRIYISFFLWNSPSKFYPFQTLSCLFIIHLREFFMYSECKFFTRCITFPAFGLPFLFLDDVFCRAENCNLSSFSSRLLICCAGFFTWEKLPPCLWESVSS